MSKFRGVRGSGPRKPAGKSAGSKSSGKRRSSSSKPMRGGFR